MQNSAKPISAIICFNGGSCGDLLLTLCMSQLPYHFEFKLESAGFVNLKKQYFKEITKQIYHGKHSPDKIDFALCKPIENTHYTLDLYQNLADQIYFIDYADHLQQSVLTRYIEKRYHNNWQEFLLSNQQFLPVFAQNKVCIDNCADLFNIQWKKNLTEWRRRPNMIAVNFEDFFTYSNMQSIVEKITGRPIQSQQMFDSIYLPWQKKNLRWSG
jgi:hypothetical protein